MAIATQLFASSDGVEIGCELVGVGDPVLLVHGTSSARQRWQPVVASLSSDHELWLMDRRGRGLSGDASAHSLGVEVDDVVAAARHAKAVSIVAHSYGAVCAVEAALRCPSLRSLVLYEPPISVPPFAENPQDEANIKAIEDLVALDRHEDAVLLFQRDILRMGEAQIGALRSQPGWTDRVALAPTLPRELRAVRRYRFDASRFASLRIPVLLLLGGDSPRRYFDAAALVTSGLPNIRCVELPGQQHNAITTAPALFSREVLNFLNA